MRNPILTAKSLSCRRAALAAVGAVVAGCSLMSSNQPIDTGTPRTTAPYSEAPVASNFQTTSQHKLQAGQHWLAIADDTGQWILATLKKHSACAGRGDRCSPLYVAPPAPITEFSRAFHTQLVTTLVNQRAAVARAAGNGLTVEVDVQPVLFSANRPQYRYAGVPVELAPGVWAIRDVTTATPPNPAAGEPKTDALHWFRSEFAAGQTPRAEIVVTTSIGDQNRYLARASAVYYVADSDLSLYNRELCPLFEPCPAGEAPKKEEAPPKNGATLPTINLVGDCPLDKPCLINDAPVKRVDATQPAKKK